MISAAFRKSNFVFRAVLPMVLPVVIFATLFSVVSAAAGPGNNVTVPYVDQYYASRVQNPPRT